MLLKLPAVALLDGSGGKHGVVLTLALGEHGVSLLRGFLNTLKDRLSNLGFAEMLQLPIGRTDLVRVAVAIADGTPGFP